MGAIARFIEERSYSVADFARDMDRRYFGKATASGVNVSETTALNTTAVYACVSLLAETVASLPLPVYRRLQPRGKERALDHYLYKLLHDAPNPEMSSYQFREVLQGHLGTWGNAYAEIEWDERTGRIRALWPLRPDCMKVKREQGKLTYTYRLPDGIEARLPAYRIWHIPGFGYDGLVGYSPIRLAREAIGLAMATEEFGARFFGQGTHMGMVAKHPKTLSTQGHTNLENSLNEQYSGLDKAFRMMVLEEGMDIVKIGIPPEDAQFLETRKFQLAEIARFYHIPPHMVGDLERATFSNIEQQSIEFVVYTMRPWLVRWEQSARLKLMGPEERQQYFIEFLVDGLLRGDAAARAAYYNQMFMVGAISPNDIREKENMNPIDGGDKTYIPLNMMPADQSSNPSTTVKAANYNSKRGMSPDDWKEAYEEGTPHWAVDLDPSLFAQDFVEELKNRKLSGKLLEIGCGNGRDSIFFSKAGFKVTAIDIAPGAIELSKENAKAAGVDVDFQEANAEDLPFEDSMFSAIFTLSVLHATNLNKSISESARVLKGNGLFFVYIYGSTESIDGTTEQTITIDSFMQLLKTAGYGILDFYSEQQEQYDEAGEKHQILVALAERTK